MSAAPKRRSPILYIVIGLIVACLICAGVVYVVIRPAISAVGNVITAMTTAKTNSDTFMNAIVAKDYTKAFGLVATSAQGTFGGSPSGMQTMIEGQNEEPTSYTYQGVNATTDANNQLVVLINGTGSFNGTTRYVYLQLQQDGNDYKVTNYTVNDTAPTATPVGTP